jgi:hypothetical protein
MPCLKFTVEKTTQDQRLLTAPVAEKAEPRPVEGRRADNAQA